MRLLHGAEQLSGTSASGEAVLRAGQWDWPKAEALELASQGGGDGTASVFLPHDRVSGFMQQDSTPATVRRHLAKAAAFERIMATQTRNLYGKESPSANGEFILDRNVVNLAIHRIERAVNSGLILDALSLVGLHSTADRIRYLYDVEDDDPEDQPISLDSLRHCMLFVVRHQHLPCPQIAVSPDGSLLTEWASVERGVASMWFLPSGDARYAAVAAGMHPQPVARGCLPPDQALAEVIQVIRREGEGSANR